MTQREDIKAEHIRQSLHDFRRSAGKLKQLTPDTVSGFAAMFTKIMQDGVIPLKTKELIAVAIGVAVNCEHCICGHVENCLKLGLTKEEILDAASVAVMMGGGPAWTHMPIVLETIEALQAPAPPAQGQS
jgi:AhpD family alkylhydroperoxidase